MTKRYSHLEGKIATFLSAFPFLKRSSKKAWYISNYILFRKKYTYRVFDPNIKLSLIGEKGGNFFFGYYDKSPFSVDEKSILYHKTPHSYSKKPSPKKTVKIGIFDIRSKKKQDLAETKAWNWQQGSRLMWLNRDSIIFNDYDPKNKRYISNVLNIKSGSKRTLDFPIYDVSRNGNTALTLNFDRLAFLRPDYGYFNRRNFSKIPKKDTSDGIWFTDLTLNKTDLIISISRLTEYKPKRTMKNAYHYVNHIMLSPDGNSFIFIHRWKIKGIRYSRLFIADIKGKSIDCLLDEDMISHCSWDDKEHITCWARYNNNDAYYEIDIKTNKILAINEELSQFGDGHPSLSPDKRFLITDTYPDRKRMKKIILIDHQTANYKILAEFIEPLCLSGETRCDLHPRWSQNSNYISFDTSHTGKKEIGIIDIRNLKL